MISREYLQQLTVLIENSDANYDRFQKKVETLKKNKCIIIYGAGGCGKWFLDLLSEYSVMVTAFFDSDPEKWNTSINGIPVYSPAKNPIADEDALIIIALRSIRAQREVLRKLEVLGFGHQILYSNIWNNFFSHPKADIRKLFDIEKLALAANLLKDKKSAIVFADAVKFYTGHDHEMDDNPEQGHQYFPDDVPLKQDFSCVIDCGAYTGDTIAQLYSTFGRVNEIIAFEPDTENFQRLCQNIGDNHKKICKQLLLYPCGVWSQTKQMRFSNGLDAGSAINPYGESINQFVALDDIIFNVSPTFVKMDVEGAEVDALKGAKGLICKAKPDLAICLYHKINHLWEITLLVHSWSLGYDFYIRQHDYTMELVMYATVTSA